ncbi:MAG: DUF2974 domain-containing protein [Oscillospiraceae bacterium]|nr:DUF2974 domain-containing protein [Oscillospiraceae bacterium]
MTAEQILMLNNLIYDPVFTAEGSNAFTVGELLEFVDTDAYAKKGGFSASATTKEEWENLLSLAGEDEQLCKLRITHSKYDPETGAKMLCFYSEEDKEATVVFAGTGYNEWRDDLVAGAKSDTKQQMDALEWVEMLPYEKIVVSGHSKGGNKAMYVTVCSEKEISCIAFDGEGFSKEFCGKYQEKIEEKKENIVLYANYRDFVSCLLYPIAGKIVFLQNDGGIAADELGFGGYHCPDALFLHENGKILYKLAENGKREPAMDLLQEFTAYFMENVPKAERVQLLSFFGDVFQRLMGKGEGEYRNDILKTVGLDAGRDFLIYFRAFLKEKREQDPSGYREEMKSLSSLLDEFAGLPSAAATAVPALLRYAEEKELFSTLITMTRGAEEAFVIRDFTQETKERMLEAAGEAEREPFWKVSRWDCWYRIEEATAGISMSTYAGEVDEYYRRLIDLNDAGTKEIERIFLSVCELDSQYAKWTAQENEKLRQEVQKLKMPEG